MATERTRFFDGERLAAADLLAAHAYERELRWLHNRTLHPWGVARGLEVTAASGDRSVTVGAGYALDCRGRDLIVAEPLTLQVPPLTGDGAGGPARFLVTVSHLDDDALPATTRGGVCGTSGAVRLPERALVRFQDPTDVDADTRVRPGIDVVLAQVAVRGCALSEPPSAGQRQQAVVPGPYVGAGQTPAGQTRWRLHPSAANADAVATTVDTTSAGFAQRPRYQAEVLGRRDFIASGGATAYVNGFVAIDQPGPASFDVVVTLPRDAAGDLNPAEVLTAAFAQRLGPDLGWCVSWIGVET